MDHDDKDQNAATLAAVQQLETKQPAETKPTTQGSSTHFDKGVDCLVG